MKLSDICRKVAFNALKIGDAVKHRNVANFFYKVTGKTLDDKIEVKVYNEETGERSLSYPKPEIYYPTQLYRKNS